MDMIKVYNPDFDEDKLAEMQYGVEGLYLELTKLFVITLLSIVFGIFKEYILLLLLFNVIRFTAFGIHATKSIYCWISSTLTFIVMPMLCKHLVLPLNIRLIIGATCVLIFLLHAPSDTPKRPLIKKKKRMIYKFSTVFIALIYTICACKIDINFIHNAFLAAMIIQSVLIHPLSYKIFKIPYNNYKTYVSSNK